MQECQAIRVTNLFQIGTHLPVPTFAILSFGGTDWRVVTTRRVGFRTRSVNGTLVLRRMGLSMQLANRGLAVTLVLTAEIERSVAPVGS